MKEVEKAVKILRKLIEILSERMGIHENSLTVFSELTSLNMTETDVHIIMDKIQQYFNININEEEIRKLETVEDLLNLIEEKVG